MSRGYVEKRLAEFALEQRRAVLRKRLRAWGRGIDENRRYTKSRVLEPSAGKLIHEDAWTPPSVEILTVGQIAVLPTIDSSARRPGVYFLLWIDELRYVGSSIQVRSRVGNHDLDRDLNDRVQFDRATYLAVPWPWHMAIEALYIRHYKPSGNSNHVNSAAEQP